MTSNITNPPEGKSPAPTPNIAKIQVDGALTFIESAKKGLTGLDDILTSGVELRPDLLSGITDSVLMILGYAESHARQASQTLDALVDGGVQ